MSHRSSFSSMSNAVMPLLPKQKSLQSTTKATRTAPAPLIVSLPTFQSSIGEGDYFEKKLSEISSSAKIPGRKRTTSLVDPVKRRKVGPKNTGKFIPTPQVTKRNPKPTLPAKKKKIGTRQHKGKKGGTTEQLGLTRRQREERRNLNVDIINVKHLVPEDFEDMNAIQLQRQTLKAQLATYRVCRSILAAIQNQNNLQDVVKFLDSDSVKKEARMLYLLFVGSGNSPQDAFVPPFDSSKKFKDFVEDSVQTGKVAFARRLKAVFDQFWVVCRNQRTYLDQTKIADVQKKIPGLGRAIKTAKKELLQGWIEEFQEDPEVAYDQFTHKLVQILGVDKLIYSLFRKNGVSVNAKVESQIPAILEAIAEKSGQSIREKFFEIYKAGAQINECAVGVSLPVLDWS